MSVDIFYRTAVGRAGLKILQNMGLFRVAAGLLHTRVSRLLISHYIRKYKIDMRDFRGQQYASFADFFARFRDGSVEHTDPGCLISPCDGLLSVYPVTRGMNLSMKGSHYRLADLLPERKMAEMFRDGLCLVFRLQASDYHHFCSFDDCFMSEAHFIQGQLHSVQPIACETVPVYRLNRRWWSVLETEHFGTAVQIEVGAMLVGGVTFAKTCGSLKKGQEMGRFELAGSTIILLLPEEAKNRLELSLPVRMCYGKGIEIPVKMGEIIGALRHA